MGIQVAAEHTDSYIVQDSVLVWHNYSLLSSISFLFKVQWGSDDYDKVYIECDWFLLVCREVLIDCVTNNDTWPLWDSNFVVAEARKDSANVVNVALKIECSLTSIIYRGCQNQKTESLTACRWTHPMKSVLRSVWLRTWSSLGGQAVYTTTEFGSDTWVFMLGWWLWDATTQPPKFEDDYNRMVQRQY